MGRSALVRSIIAWLMLSAAQMLGGCAVPRSPQLAPSPRSAIESLPPLLIDAPPVRIHGDVSQELAAHHADWIHRSIIEFNRFARELGLPQPDLEAPIVAVLFTDAKLHRRFALAHDGVRIGDVTGYYSPRNDWIVLCIPGAGHRVTNPLTPGGSAVSLTDDSSAAMHRNAARCLHEAAHLLAHRAGICSAAGSPWWLNEGLATVFESDDPQAPFGPDHSHPSRERLHRHLVATGRGYSLRALIALARPPRDPRQIAAAYNQSHALVRWLWVNRRDEFRRFLLEIAADGPGPDGGQAAFIECFGSLRSVEAAWLADTATRHQ